MTETVIIIGAGPAGLTAALELTRRSGIKPIVLEALQDVGGISRTIEYKGNRMDIGGHRFFSKSDWVMDWWRDILPLAPETGPDGVSVIPKGDRHLLVRPRLSRIYFLRRFFDYPISLTTDTMRKLGLFRLIRIGVSYVLAKAFPRRPERNLEDFFHNRFGGELYRTFFKGYTEKVWGIACRDISPEWGAQRIKGLSVTQALLHALRKMASPSGSGIAQKQTNTSLIERFLYPKFGPGQMWQTVAEKVINTGGEIRFGITVTGLRHDGMRITSVDAHDSSGVPLTLPCSHVISTMPVRDLVLGLSPSPPEEVLSIAAGLRYRDFITVGLLVRKLKPGVGSIPNHRLNLVPDTWIYIQEPDVRLGRLQVFNNWSPAMVSDADTIWLGLEYFCQEGDELWTLTDDAVGKLAAEELARIDLVVPADIIDFKVIRVPKAYPAYFGTYDRFNTLREFTDRLANLYLVGRNGMHRYNNQDHSMVTARMAVESILGDAMQKARIWQVNIDDDYHESHERSTPAN